ncbi:interferon-induced GTP-binding protein Mx-like isoform X2 [Paramisgurnus dabryanus]|uniref:interferon-induced GTP-binding protein Mx-like isoform X2 n=1 Tax=Paramisgurnus dabryanus TaxID=90735 RepID=UPI0031F3DBD5
MRKQANKSNRMMFLENLRYQRVREWGRTCSILLQHIKSMFPYLLVSWCLLVSVELCLDNSSEQGFMNNLNEQYEKKVRPFIDLVDGLRLLGIEKDLNLPAIAVIGDQSSGKSSVLEALSGVALPRGTGIVTRCPLELKLKRVSKNDAWNGLLSYNDKKINLTNPAEIEKAVLDAQTALAGEGEGISHEMITLEIKSSDVPDLTLIDLPGIARVATGNQPSDIGIQIKDLIKKYIERQETINLVVIPANIDIATTEALQMASNVDPDGNRTLGILTKPDLVDKGMEETVVKTVNNLVIPLKKGYMIVKCRGQQEINENLTLVDALEKERQFFNENAHFRPLLEERKATVRFLAERLTNVLAIHIINSLPQLQTQLNEKLTKTTEELKVLGDEVPLDQDKRNDLLTMKIRQFYDVLEKVKGAEEDLKDTDIRVFSKIRTEFGEWNDLLDKTVEQILRSDQIEVYIKTYRGKELPGFINYKTFESIFKKHIEELEEPALKILKDVTDIVHNGLDTLASHNFKGFPDLLTAAKHPIEDILENEFQNAEEKVKSQFRMEKIVYSQDPLYQRQLEAVNLEVQKSSFRDDDALEIAKHLKAYLTITFDRLANQVPLIIHYHMLEQYIFQLQNEMLAMIKRNNTEGLLKEDSGVARKRKELKDRLERLKNANKQIKKFVKAPYYAK